MRAVVAPAGDRDVEFFYFPRHLKAGLAISLVTLGVLSWLFFGARGSKVREF